MRFIYNVYMFIVEMDSAKDICAKRKSNSEEAFDDSFEVFLPNKLKEKSLMSHVNVNSRNNSNRRKKFSPTSSASTSQESYDTDMDQVMAVCLCKDKYISTLYNSVNKEIRNTSWKDLTHKMKRQPLLISRTIAEREAILSQKLAVILVENNVNDDFSNSNYSLIDMEDLIQSDLLLQQWNKTCRLWSAAKLQTLQLKDYYIAALSNYMDFDDACNSDKNASLTFDSVKPREIVIAKNDTAATKLTSHEIDSFMLKDDGFDEKMDDQSAVDMFDVYQTEEECCDSDNVVSPEIASQSDDNGSKNETNTTYTYGISATPAEIIELSSSPSSDRTVRIPSTFDKRESPLIFSPAHSFSSIATDQLNKNLVMLDRIGVTLLSQQWDNLFNSNEGDVTVLLDNEATLNVHKFVLSVRCQSLIYEIHEDRLLWNMYSLEAAKAFFRYLYTGKCDHLWCLTTLEKATVKRLARLYQLNHLEEVLIKLHETTYDQMKSQSRNDRQVVESINKLTYSSSLLLSNSPENLTSRLKPQNSSTNSEEHQLSGIEDNSINNLSNTEINSAMIMCSDPYESVRSPTLSYKYVGGLQSDCANKNVAHCNVKKSLEAYFQESFPALTNLSGLSTSVDINLAANEVNTSAQSDQDSNGLLCQTPDIGKNRHFIDSPLISSHSPKSWSSSYSTSDKVSAPSTTFPLSSPRKSTTLQLTPSCSSSEVYFSKNVTPFPDYDSMITPQLKRELKKFGLKENLGSTKAKLLLKYIYDQIHPVVESDGEEQDNSSAQTQSSSAKHIDSLTKLVGNIVKSNKELYTHILLFKPIWLENFYQLLKEQGIVCSANQLKDALNTLGITYRTKNTRKIISSKKSSKR